MPNLKISQFNPVTTLNDAAIFLIDQNNSTATVTFSTIATNIIAKVTDPSKPINFIVKPTTTSADDGKVLTYQHSTQTWIPSSVVGTGGVGPTNNYYDSIPIGSVSYFAASGVPVGWLECNGQIVSKSEYDQLFAIVGDTFTATKSANHFKLPELRGEFIRGWSNKRATVDVGRGFGTSQDDMFEAHSHTIACKATINSGGAEIPPLDSIGSDGSYSTNSTGGTETRPRNVALLPCIKAVRTVTGTTNALNFIPRPASASNKQVLTYNNTTSTWGASSLSSVGFAALLSSNGWQELPNGFIMQWGSISFAGGSRPSVTATFPKPFPNQAVFATAIRTTTNATIVERSALTNSIATFYMIDREVGKDVVAGILNWQAFGY